jgi:hypothetical protein
MHDRYSWSPFSFVFLFTYKDNGFPAIFFTSSKLYHTICRMNLKYVAKVHNVLKPKVRLNLLHR